MAPLMEALAGGGCPNMTELILGFVGELSDSALASVLSYGHCRKLISLTAGLSDHARCLLLFRVVGGGGCHHLRVLNLQWSGRMFVDNAGTTAVLGSALAAGSCMELEEFHLGQWSRLTDVEMVSIMDGIRLGRCCKIRRLILKAADLGLPATLALTQAVAMTPLIHLQELQVFAEARRIPPAINVNMVELIGALASSCAGLCRLCLTCVGMGPEAGEVLLQALAENAWPHLRALDVFGNDIGDAIIGVRLAKVLEGGGGSLLEDLRVRGCGLSNHGIQCLLEAFRKGACPKLTVLSVKYGWQKLSAFFEDRPGQNGPVA